MLFKDIDMSMRKLANGSIGEKTGTTAIIQSIQDIILTEEGEDLETPTNFTNISDYLQGTVNIFSSLSLKREIYSSLNNQLKNVIIGEDDVVVTTDYDNNLYNVLISYRESELSEKQDIEFELKITR